MTSIVNAGSVAATSGSTVSQVGNSALNSLSGNFNNFLTMLMTQLKNQDPTSPLDANQFTSQLVQFSSVEQQINTNSNLTQLIQLNQASQIEQSASMIGKPVTISGTQVPLQNGHASINFNTSVSEPVNVAVFNASNVQIQGATLTSKSGTNTWNWNGQAANGLTLPDGAYRVTVSTTDTSGNVTQIPFTITGTATAVTNHRGTVDLSLGSMSVPFSSVVSVGN